MLQRVAVCCSVMQGVERHARDVRLYQMTGVLQRDAAGCSVLQLVVVCCRVSKDMPNMCYSTKRQVCCSVLQCVAACCSVLQRAAVCCSVLQCVSVCGSVMLCVAV